MSTEGGKERFPELETETPGSPFPIIALGASAGGLAAVSLLLRGLGAKPGFAVVLVQHLDPTYASNLVELLSKITPIPVEAVRDGTVVETDRVYVIPPGTQMEIERGTLHLKPRAQGPAPHLPIDAFFDSLAEERGSRAVAVVLSGTGADGARGVQAIKAEGGITFAQDGAEHAGMPRSAIATGCVDFVLPVESIASELARLAARSRSKRDDPGAEDESFNRIILAIKQGTGVDFTHYKPTTLRRRMQRRAVLRRAGSLREYADLVMTEPAEVEALSEEVLIHVTSFFRDPEVFEALKKDIFPRLVANRGTEPIRVWVPGCSSGEEVYSLAIGLAEFLAETGASQTPVKMFGTDVSRRAIERARAGVYHETIVEDVSPERLARFFLKTERGYEIIKEVRDRCVFATHDIARDPPFSKMDLISCRNLMIYLGPTLQQRILPMFHYALNEPGFLVLGTAESVGTFVGFTPAGSRNKIYARTPGAVRLAFDFGDVRGWSAAPQAPLRPLDRATIIGDVRKDADRAILSAIAPAGVVVSDDLAIVEFRGDIAPYLEPVPGVATLDLSRMAREELRLTLRRAIDEARTSGKPIRSVAVTIGSAETRSSVDVDVIPFTVAPAGTRFFAVLFSGRAALATSGIAAAPEDAARGAAEETLRRELDSTREYLQSVIEQLEAGNEELKAANEEIVSSNEELQSTNEELQTAKEELQATNEELRTVNDEMLDRNVEASRLADDLTNILSSVAIPIVILGRDSRIRRFTPMATKILNLIATDLGRPMTDIQAKIQIPELRTLVADVLEHLVPIEKTVRAEDGRWYQLGVRPYRTLDNRIDGVVLSVYDIDVLKKAELTLADDVSARREAERKIAEYQSKLQRMAFEAALGEERERRLIAQNLHDGVGQSLALARIKLEAVQGAAGGDVRAAIVAAVGLIATSIEDTRTLTFELAPPVLYDLGLKPALAWLCEEMEKRTGVHIEVSDDGTRAPFDEATAALLFRAVRELLTNVFKHAQTSAAKIALKHAGDHFEINVEDGGAGFDVEKAARGASTGFGIFSVREQIARLGGTVEIQSTPQKGTRVSVRVPIARPSPLPEAREARKGGRNENPARG